VPLGEGSTAVGGAVVCGALAAGSGNADVTPLSAAGGVAGCETFGGGGGAGISSSGSFLIFSAVRTRKSSSPSAANR
jgi:hypothetical protein